jgi:dethiobiotin synthetase
MRGLLVLGTDTAVGKTCVAEALLRLAARRGFRLVPYKPVETGCNPEAEDARRLCVAANLPGLRLVDVCPFRFTAPVAPSVAARLAGRLIEPALLLERARELATRGDALLIESAGGLLSPYGDGMTSASLADLFDIDVLLVTANRLGTISHTALALAEIGRRRLRLAGVVLVDVGAHDAPDHAFNASEIEALTGTSPLGVLRHCPTSDPEALADAAATDLDLARLLDGALASTASS